MPVIDRIKEDMGVTLIENAHATGGGLLWLSHMLGVCLQELAREQQETSRLLAAHQEKDDLIEKLREEVDLLNRVCVCGSVMRGPSDWDGNAGRAIPPELDFRYICRFRMMIFLSAL